MNKLLRHVVIVLMFRINWKKLLILGSTITAFGVIIQILALPYPLTIWVLSPSETRLLYKSLNSHMHLNEKEPLTRLENSKSRKVDTFISVNGSMGSNHSVLSEKEEIRARKRARMLRRKRENELRKRMLATPPPPPPPPRRPVSDLVQRYLRSLTPNEMLVYAKKEIENVTVAINDPDPDLYAPLFRNVSTFGRSYEMMELILKVYIYKDGERPIFHTPHLQGIYSSEGWFMKLLEENQHFVTRDPEKAHLFYLPYSARQLQKVLQRPDKHNIRRISIFLRKYVNTLAEKYPFWNRTHGSDHFLVACHDWGPYTLNLHKELTFNTIKALCNADASEGIYKSGKDVSLPETTIRNPSKPQRGLGGRRVSQRPILAFFAGNMHGRVRPKLLKYWGDKDDDMRIYGPLPNRVSRNMSYPVHMKSSKFCLCPMGYEVNSPRIVEAIYYECVPVIIADNFDPPLGDVLNWNAFSVIVAEKDIPKLKEILVAIKLRKYLEMQNNVKMLQKHFRWNARPVRYDLFHMILHSIWNARLNQIQLI